MMLKNNCAGKVFPDIIAILVAAGLGTRMHSSVPKQYCVINKKTLLEYSASILLSQSCISQLIVVIHAQDHFFYQLPISCDPRVQVVVGGDTRMSSVMEALSYIKSNNYPEWVIIHDAVRPCLHIDDLVRLLKLTLYSSQIGGILAAPVRDTIKKSCVNSQIINSTVERDNLWHAFTPQLFKFTLLKNCLDILFRDNIYITDEAAALECFGYNLFLVPGRTDNIKVTYQEDLQLAKFYLS